MKRKLTLILAVEAILCITFHIVTFAFSSTVPSILTFPFEPIGMMLRAISNAGTIPNIFAIILYIAICLSPVAYYAYRAIKHKATIVDFLLILLSITLFAVIYMMINPADIARIFGFPKIDEISKTMLGAVVYSVIAGYVILRALHAFEKSQIQSVMKYLYMLLATMCILLIFDIFGSSMGTLLASMKQLSIDNTDGFNLVPSYIFRVLQYVVSVLPYCMDILVLFVGLTMIGALKKDPYGEDVASSAAQLIRVCRISVTVIMLSQIGVNLLQLALSSMIRSKQYTLAIPLFSVAFVLVAMLFGIYLEQARKLKEDQDMII